MEYSQIQIIFLIIKILFVIYWKKNDYIFLKNMINKLKAKSIEKPRFKKLNIDGPPRDDPLVTYCDKCCCRATEKCFVTKYIKCPNNHIWYVRHRQVYYVK